MSLATKQLLDDAVLVDGTVIRLILVAVTSAELKVNDPDVPAHFVQPSLVDDRKSFQFMSTSVVAVHAHAHDQDLE